MWILVGLGIILFLGTPLRSILNILIGFVGGILGSMGGIGLFIGAFLLLCAWAVANPVSAILGLLVVHQIGVVEDARSDRMVKDFDPHLEVVSTQYQRNTGGSQDQLLVTLHNSSDKPMDAVGKWYVVCQGENIVGFEEEYMGIVGFEDSFRAEADGFIPAGGDIRIPFNFDDIEDDFFKKHFFQSDPQAPTSNILHCAATSSGDKQVAIQHLHDRFGTNYESGGWKIETQNLQSQRENYYYHQDQRLKE